MYPVFWFSRLCVESGLGLFDELSELMSVASMGSRVRFDLSVGGGKLWGVLLQCARW